MKNSSSFSLHIFVWKIFLKILAWSMLLSLCDGQMTAGEKEESPCIAKSHARTNIPTYAAGQGGGIRRTKRAVVAFSPAEITQIVDEHNNLRRAEGASDMEEMSWNEFIADMAQEWADGCAFEHGQPTRDPNDIPYNPLGQNLYVTTVTTLDIMSANLDWYNEKPDYHFDTTLCNPPPAQCGHYTQMVWAKTRQVGCGYTVCDSITEFDNRSGVLYVCNYGPAGNYISQQPYTKGTPCTQCASGQHWCNQDLCVNCTGPGPQCVCGALCQNCGTFEATTCSCSCADGWQGVDCSALCEDLHPNCGKNPGFPAGTCDIFPPTKENCPALCSVCVQTATPATCDSTIESPSTTQAPTPTLESTPTSGPTSTSGPTPSPGPTPTSGPTPSTASTSTPTTASVQTQTPTPPSTLGSTPTPGPTPSVSPPESVLPMWSFGVIGVGAVILVALVAGLCAYGINRNTLKKMPQSSQRRARPSRRRPENRAYDNRASDFYAYREREPYIPVRYYKPTDPYTSYPYGYY